MEHDRTAGGFARAEALDAMVENGPRAHVEHVEEIQEVVALADYLVPELHRETGGEEAAEAVVEWADGDAGLLAEAETEARREQHAESAELLHRAADQAADT